MNITKIVYVVMGVSGSGKSSVGDALARRLSYQFLEGDDFHPHENITKMRSGQELTDKDRYPWLVRLNNELHYYIDKDKPVVLSCSALKKLYRKWLTNRIEENVQFIYLYGGFSLIFSRIEERSHHFMSSKLLSSQFKTLEEPINAWYIDINQPINAIIKRILLNMEEKSVFGVIGLGVMGLSLSRNLASRGHRISMYNRRVNGYEENVALKAVKRYSELSKATPFEDLEDFINSIEKPRKILMMITAGTSIDSQIAAMLPYLSENDILIDGGNSFFRDTEKRQAYLKKKKLYFIGIGVSGGEKGALYGPSIMPSGSFNAYQLIQFFLESIAATDANGIPCCTYIGNGGSGHYVKMVHNGIEYAEMQLLAECYSIFSTLGYDSTKIGEIFESWNKGNLKSYLLEITASILQTTVHGESIINKILDKAGNKGTGNWTTVELSKIGVPATMIPSALYARYISSYKKLRSKMSYLNKSVEHDYLLDQNDIRDAYSFARVINHSQGFWLLRKVSKHYKWELDLNQIARIWTNGCIIRSELMRKCVDIPKLGIKMMRSEAMHDVVNKGQTSLKEVMMFSIQSGLATPTFSDALQFFHGITSEISNAQIIQAQRDYFGAHQFRWLDDPKGLPIHFDWEFDKGNH